MNEVRTALPHIDGYRCFCCGTDNPRGLKMSFYRLGDSVRSDLVLDDHCVGWENIVHGGIITAVLDEVMAWTVIAFDRKFFVTRGLEIKFLRPVQVRVPLTAVGEILPGAKEGSRTTRGTLQNEGGAKLAVAKAEMVFLDEKRLALLPDAYRRTMTGLFASIETLFAASA